jgi:subtilisin family serine protease
VQADTAWSTTDGSGVVVGVIDSGILPSHEDFAGVAVDGYPTSITTSIRGGGEPRTTTVHLTPDDEQYWGRDYSGHGTHVSGTIAAVSNSVGVVGVTQSSIFMVKVFGDTGNWVYSSSLVNAVQQAVNIGGASVINMSLGGGAPSSTEEAGMDSFVSQGVVLVAAAGNDGNTAYSYPASYNSVISVGAVSVNGGSYPVASFSQQNDQVEIAAPGVSVLSTVPFFDNTSVSVGGSTILGNPVEYSASSSGASGGLVDGGLALGVNGAWAGKVVLVSRGDISFNDKVQNVQNSGGVAAVIYNNEPGELYATLGAGNSSTIPAIGITLADGQALLASNLGQIATVTSELQIPASGYEAWDGTSMACPHVAGGVAILLDAYPNATVQNIRDALAESALDLGPTGRDNAYGHGLLQINDALVALGAIMAGGGGGGGGGGEDPLAISGLTSVITNAKNGRFEITWSTNLPATGQVQIGSSVYTNSELTTNHKFGFRGTKGATYSYSVSSTSADGQTATGSGTHQN